MTHPSSIRRPRGSHPTHSGPRTGTGLVVFVLVLAVGIATMLYPPFGVATVAAAVAVGAGRRARRRLARRDRRPAAVASRAD